jgi:cytochrome b pre-mRNA-processing protein 3
VAKRVKKLGEAFYGRLKAFEESLTALPDRAVLTDLVTRTVLEGRGETAQAMVDYVLSAREALSGQTIERLLTGDILWEQAQ